ncbi:MAG: hypothetical protein LBR66_04100 [Candidatus Symbiothrix sp.]|jgi:hypothetical protein|nr:hypothetical protein [Candidatus Symbiothrix sp.]
MAKKEVIIEVRDGDETYSCKVKRPSVEVMSRVNKLSKTDEIVAAGEMLKGCWVEGDEEIRQDVYLTLAIVAQMGGIRDEITAEIKN